MVASAALAAESAALPAWAAEWPDERESSSMASDAYMAAATC